MTAEPMIVFEKIKRETEFQKEYWSARELAKALEYADYRNFITVLKKANGSKEVVTLWQSQNQNKKATEELSS